MGVRSICGAGLVVILLLAGCAHSYEPVVDLKHVDQEKYQQDLNECRSYADKVDPLSDAGTHALIGGAFGAALGAATGAVVGNAGAGAALGAAAGGIGGAGEGGLTGAQRQKSIINKCLSGRGYKVLG